MHYFGITKKIVERPLLGRDAGVPEPNAVLKRIYLARGIKSDVDLQRGLAQLPSPWLLTGMEEMVIYLINAIEQQKKIVIVADFDADGATSCTVAMKGLKLLGADNVDFIVPNRFEYGYGLTPEIVELVKEKQADVLVTVDNGISSLSGVQAAKQAGIQVLVTDHHLPGDQLPDADAIVNPNLPNDEFPSRALAGVGVMFYVLMALRSRMREQGWFITRDIAEPNLAQLLDLVALGTIADVVALDQVNRILVHQGLLRIRSGKGHKGIKALVEIAGRNLHSLGSSDLGFAIGPRLNAAGRMDDMSVGIQCLLSNEEILAKKLAQQMDELNSDRREVEGQMKQEAMSLLKDMNVLDEQHLTAGVCIYNEDWHQGVIGILASRIKDRLNRPVIAFANAGDGEVKGSARSIPGVHIRDVLSDIAVAHPKVLQKFGGHAMAAGLSIQLHDYPVFMLAFDKAVEQRLVDVDLDQKVYTDGELTDAEMTIGFCELLKNAGPWGQEFPEPLFHGVFDVVQSRIVGQQHLKLVLRKQNDELLIDAIAFFVERPEYWLGIRQVNIAYKLDINEYKGQRSIQFIIDYIEKLA
ncbi:single-stranded-DNA-specific exonuclease [Bathymodiolus platifrons methanotrophic gill symbiont]|uniref:single-stranded-DNA-specific exonuclease RecJ n=1 Tax=Bathymodiolus platifrons methanotrophic gill symbiont TaxID=113268 RepID=UPI000B4204AC|nr:single-stranded-DNA-specific exonuclease RecJ [Bathymodiolus platifrons methanotrophic gill symbiont]MCK5871091.1 single-stranded-DNA-specific exonuclease RecJ [Methyloprofundus sp.]TXK95081.1 single-stranded-DNA-specific exonuclease RecJ [Methylococcaceae bacterium CS5]TXK98002.1 single-stranded-DNA-specific exonuclease RecJ [Methylococcaceae bacterium CS4]TXL04139.1 single-stranded-DNA-specific exonuclease RecJ [Methylococcaceae bacterium CS1]TXL07066.1 single-stranded-DNA-specific exonuc